MSHAQPKTRPMGATVYAAVTVDLVGPTIHALEYAPEVHLIKRIRCRTQQLETFVLRSDQFPPEWEGQGVALCFGPGGLIAIDRVTP